MIARAQTLEFFARKELRIMFHLSSTGKESSAGGENKTVESGQKRAEDGGQSDVEAVPVEAAAAEVPAPPNANGVARPPDIEIADEAAERLQDLAV